MGLPERLHRLVDAFANLPGPRNWRERSYEHVFSRAVGQNLHRGVFPTFEAAQGSAPAGKPIGYDNPESAALYLERTRRILVSDYAAMFWLGRSIEQGARRIFDLGGNIGTSYYAFQTHLDYPEDLEWVIHDVPAVVKRGREFARSNDHLRRLSFADDAGMASGADVLLAFGVLQFLGEPFAAILSRLAAPPPEIIVNRLPLHPTDDYFTLQSIGTAFCPYRVSAEGSFVTSVRDLGYEVVDHWRTPENRCHIPFEETHSLDGFHGLYFRKADAPGP